jgi:hypothetical protein
MSAAAQYMHYTNEIARYTSSLAALKPQAKNEHSEASKLLNDRERHKRLIATHAKSDEVERVEDVATWLDHMAFYCSRHCPVGKCTYLGAWSSYNRTTTQIAIQSLITASD